MHQIIINETPLWLISTEYLQARAIVATEKILVNKYLGKKKQLFSIIDNMEKAARFACVYLYYDDVEKLYHDFESIYKTIGAAGGIVFLEGTANMLVMYRRGSWDLPKGKIDKGETIPQAALREVQEETGLQQVSLGEYVGTTLHTYTLREQRILKTTYWYKMTTAQQSVQPQTEEDIEQLDWVEVPTFLNTYQPIYKNIRAILEQCSQI